MRLERSARRDRDRGPQYSAPHPAERLLVAPRWTHHLTAVGMAALTLGLGVASLQIIPPNGNGAAVWWPAAGTGVLLALLFRGPLWVPLSVIAGTGLLANLAAGRPIEFALVAMVILTVEALIVVGVVGRHGQMARLDGLRGLGQLFLACLAGALGLAALGSTSLFVLAGAPLFSTAVALSLSHISALLLMVPIALVPLSRRTLHIKPLRVAEGVAQFSVTLGLSAVLFSPVLPIPMLFLLFPLLAWAAARFRPLYVVAQLAAVALLIPALYLLVGGPYLAVPNVGTPGLLVQLFMVSAAITTLFLAVGRSEREALIDERERRAVLLRGGFIGAQVGFLVAQRENGALTIVESNEIGRQMAKGGWLEPIISTWLQHPQVDLTQEVTLETGRSYQVFASVAGHALHDDDTESAVGIQLVEITDTIAARDALARTLERERAVTVELRELARQKDVFVSAVSHELRTPITSILGFAEEIDDTGPAATKQAAEVIIRNSRRLATMVDQLLELGRVSTAALAPDYTGADLRTLVDHAIEEQRLSAERAGVTLEANGHDEHEVIVAMESLALGRVLTNLISNAIKFTPTGGSVALSCDTTAGRALVHIDDSGVGIPVNEREKVFDRFFRSADQTKLAVPGTGLGLPIVRALVEAAGGTVNVFDSPLGGTRLTLDLPLRTVAPSAAVSGGAPATVGATSPTD